MHESEKLILSFIKCEQVANDEGDEGGVLVWSAPRPSAVKVRARATIGYDKKGHCFEIITYAARDNKVPFTVCNKSLAHMSTVESRSHSLLILVGINAMACWVFVNFHWRKVQVFSPI